MTTVTARNANRIERKMKQIHSMKISAGVFLGPMIVRLDVSGSALGIHWMKTYDVYLLIVCLLHLV